MSKIAVTIFSNDPSLISVLDRYWVQDEDAKFPHRATELAKELGLRPHELSALVRDQTCAVVSEWTCNVCGEPSRVSSRADYQQKTSLWRWALSRGQQLTCEHCRENARREQQVREDQVKSSQREKIQARYGVRSLQDEPTFYGLKDVVSLLAFIRFAASETLEWLSPVDNLDGILTPTEDFTDEVIKHLYHQRLTGVHPGSDLSAFVWEEGEPKQFYIRKVFWTVGASADEAKTFVRRAESVLKSAEWPVAWLRELPAFIEEVMVHECFQFLSHCLAEYRLPFTPGEKTRIVFLSVLQDFTLGQVFNMIWRNAKDAAAFYQRGGVTAQHAANIVPGGVQRYADQARANGWSLKSFTRNTRLPLSALSHALFDTALNLGSKLTELSLGQIEAAARVHLVQVSEFMESIRECLNNDRNPGRTMIHEILVRTTIRSESIEELARLTEDVTMGEMEWDDYVAYVEDQLDWFSFPRYI